VLATGPTSFSATQQALGALAFLPQMEKMKPVNALGDPAGCLKGTFTTMTLKQLYLRQMRYITEAISQTIVISRADYSDFAMLVRCHFSDACQLFLCQME
jgi:hypothetical protein